MGNHVPATTAVPVTDAVTPLDPAATQRKRRTLFVALLAAVLLPALVAVVLPTAQADDTVFVASDTDVTMPASVAPTSATQPSTTATAPVTSSHSTSTTAKPKATTTTTAKPKPTTTTTAKPKAAPAPPAPAAPAVATPAPTGSGASASEAAFLACVRKRESGGNYAVVSSNGLWFGAYQMTRQTWDSTAQRAGRPDLVGVPPNQASPGDQDYLAVVLYRWLGKSPWGGAC